MALHFYFKLNLLFATVRMLRTRFNNCAFVVGSPKLCIALFAPHPTEMVRENITIQSNIDIEIKYLWQEIFLRVECKQHSNKA